MARIGDLVIAGVASFQNINPIDGLIMAPPFRGSVVARDAKSGAKVWEWVPVEAAAHARRPTMVA